MEFVTDLLLHSKYSRAVSPQMVLPEMAKWAAKKGINLLTSGDFTHPLWFRNIKAELEEAGEGGYKLKIKKEKKKKKNWGGGFFLKRGDGQFLERGKKREKIFYFFFPPHNKKRKKK